MFDLPYILRLPGDRRIKISSDGMSFLLSCKNADSLKVQPWIELGENEIASIVFEHADERFVFDSSTLRSTVAIDTELDSLDNVPEVVASILVWQEGRRLVAWYQKFGSGDAVVYYTGVALIGGLLMAMLVTQELLPYKNWFKQIDGWLKMIESNKRIPDMKELVQLKDRLQSTGHLILIFLVVLDFYYSIVSTYDKVLLFLGFLIAGVVVVLLTHGGIGMLKKERQIAPSV